MTKEIKKIIMNAMKSALGSGAVSHDEAFAVMEYLIEGNSTASSANQSSRPKPRTAILTTGGGCGGGGCGRR